MFSATTFSLQVLLASTAMAQTFGVNCFLEVPQNPLSATGLATPFQLSNCDQTQFATQANFVEAAILDPATGAIQIYNPLVINANATVPNVDFIPPVVPTLPANAIVGIFYGSNAVTLTLTGDTAGGNCVNGDGNSIFGQFAYCNTPAFFEAAYAAVSSGLLVVPPPGTTTKTLTPQPCPVTRDFRMVDMDQSDNVDSTYLLIGGTKLAQDTPANAKANPNSTDINNGSDNLLLNAFLSPTLGCTPWTAPCITSATGVSSAMALNEIQSQFFVPAGGPALVPLDDDFTVIANGGNVTQSLIKTNLYRAGVGQPQAADAANASATTYCTRYAASGIFIAENQALLSTGTSPAPGASSDLYTFLANRFAASFGPVPALGCQTIFGLTVSPVNQTLNGDCIVVAATINTTVLNDIINGVILPLGSTTTATSSVSTALSTTATTSSTLATTAPFLNTTFAQTTTQAATTTQATLATTSTTTSALTATTSVTTTTVLVEVVTFFVFVLSLGGAAPGVTGSIEEFIVLEETFMDLPAAASAACTHQFNNCASLAGSAFSGTDCLNQLNSCQGVATTASPTATTPGTVTATATVPTTSTVAPAATTAIAAGNAGGAKEVSGAGAGAPAGAGGDTCSATVTVTSCAAQATVTVTVVPSGVASPSAGVGYRHSHGKNKIRQNNVREAEPVATVTNYWKA